MRQEPERWGALHRRGCGRSLDRRDLRGRVRGRSRRERDRCGLPRLLPGGREQDPERELDLHGRLPRVSRVRGRVVEPARGGGGRLADVLERGADRRCGNGSVGDAERRSGCRCGDPGGRPQRGGGRVDAGARRRLLCRRGAERDPADARRRDGGTTDRGVPKGVGVVQLLPRARPRDRPDRLGSADLRAPNLGARNDVLPGSAERPGGRPEPVAPIAA